MRSFATICFSILLSFNLCSQSIDFSGTDFRKADSVALHYANHSLYDLKGLAEKLTSPFQNDVEKFRAIYFWVCNNIESDYQYYLINEKSRKRFKDQPDRLKAWNVEFSKRVYQRLLLHKKTVCTGYAYLIRELSYWAGLTSIIVDGYGRSVKSNVGGSGTANHSWNAIQLNGQWYLCDATWSSGTIDPATGTFKKKFDEAYFLSSPATFVLHHYPLDTTMIFLKDKPTLQQFLEGPIVYKGAYYFNVTPTFPTSFDVTATRGETISFCFNWTKDKSLKEIELQVNGRIRDSLVSVEKDGHHCIDYTFKNTGNHVVHVLSNSNYLFTYRIKVR